jgi:hypothetical protein
MSKPKNKAKKATSKIEDFLNIDTYKKLMDIKRKKELEISKKREKKDGKTM